MWLYLALALHTILNLTALYFLIKDGSSALRIWTWILVILFLPGLGAILYYFFGVNWRKIKMFNLKKVTDNQQFRQFISEHSQEMEEGLSKRSDITGN